MELDVVILAAGKGTRMRSKLAKVLHPLAGKSMIQRVVQAAAALSPRNIAVVVGHQADEVKQHLGEGPIYVDQLEQNGTGHAVQLAMATLPDEGITLVLYGDVPLVSDSTLKQSLAAAVNDRVGLITAHFDNPAQLGRIVRNAKGDIEAIVEFKDADDAQREIREINSGILAVPSIHLKRWLNQIKPNNAQGEYYLTDIIAMAASEGVAVEGIVAQTPEEVTGVNDREQLAELERIYQHQQAQQLMHDGTTLADPKRIDIRGSVKAGQDCFIDVNVVFEGDVILGDGVRIGAGSVITDSYIGDNSQVHPHTVVEGAKIANGCSLGPFARIRPGTRLENDVKVGNFVETKKVHLGEGTKASHLTYLGDATLGADCNVGAGTVTCNYDGVNKHTTTIGDGVFIGTNSTLVAPVDIESQAFVAAGSTVTTKVPEGELAVGRGKQRNIRGWTRPDRRDKSKGS